MIRDKAQFHLKSGLVGCASNWKSGGREFNPRQILQHSFMEIDCEIFLGSCSPFRWFKKGSCQFLAKRMCTILVNYLEDKACLVKVWLGKLTTLNMTPLGWLGHNLSQQTQMQKGVIFLFLHKSVCCGYSNVFIEK